MSVYLVSQSFKSSFSNVRINVLLSVSELCNLCWYDPLNFLGRIQSSREKQSWPHKASEQTRKWTCQARGPQRGEGTWRLYASLLSLQARRHLIYHKLKVTGWALRSQAWIKRSGYKKPLAANVNKMKTRQNNLNLCKWNYYFFWGGSHI